MSSEPSWGDVPRRLKSYGIWAVAGLIDSTFLVIWILVQAVASWFTSRFQLGGLDTVIQFIVRIIFAFSTVVPVALHTYADIRIMAMQMARRIQDERMRRP